MQPKLIQNLKTMGKFIKYYALEIYTVISLMMLVCAAMIDTLSVVQKFVVVSTALFILHEWEENSYPGGFIDILSRALQSKTHLLECGSHA